ncbi:alpha/beta fold hydrolase [Marinilongibacter aquaticus]|uniref:YheT family hydrolase n=1 Tax=Marinilongibacter aquaticus TaxID=2975157 RepID=UPI0021BDB145|nr:alpha/beta fold hydrolase [Marinilongibacter aquaticus]UBM59891.1 alpha/beta fold hydrolase [Marinilongibacter aquaticus]
MKSAEKHSLKPPFWQFNGHVQTIYPSLYRKIEVPYVRERLELDDGDFLNLDWLQKGSDKLAIVTHGLEGDSTRPYVTGMLQTLVQAGFDGLGWNCRSCGGEMNRLPRFYHHGDSEDLRAVVEHAIKAHGYKEIMLVGFSMGGNITLRLMAEFPESVPNQISKALAVSSPIDLYSSVTELNKSGKRFYMRRFIRKLGKKIEIKSKLFPEHPNLDFANYKQLVKCFEDFDNRYTAPLHGYKNAMDFYEKATVKPILHRIRKPTFILQAMNDPFLGEACFRLDEPLEHVQLVLTAKGGHVGFMQQENKMTFAEKFALQIAQKEKHP